MEPPATDRRPDPGLRIAQLEARLAELDARNLALEQEIARRGVKLACARVALARATIRFDQVTAERQEAEARLVLSRQVASVSQLAAGVAHELNTPAGSLRSASDTLSRAVAKLGRELEPGGEAGAGNGRRVETLLSVMGDVAEVFRQGSERVDQTVRRLLGFTALDGAELRPHDVRDGIRDTLAVLRPEVGPCVRLTAHLDEVPRIDCRPRALNLALLNLLRNAVVALDGAGEITVRTYLEREHVCVSIHDTGVGIADDERPSLFDPSLRPRGDRVGAGMGLPICARIVAEHGGEIRVDSVPGEGSTFTLCLPAPPPQPITAGHERPRLDCSPATR